MKNIALITLNNPGINIALDTIENLKKINSNFNLSLYIKNDIKNINNSNINKIIFSNLDEIIKKAWLENDAVIFYAATGIVIRKISKLIDSKFNDPAIIVMNLKGTQIIPLLSGHKGGANNLVRQLTDFNKDIIPFITTATDTLEVISLDTFCEEYGMNILNPDKLPYIANKIINEEHINLYTYHSIKDLLIENGLSENIFSFIDIANINNQPNISFTGILITPFQFHIDELEPQDVLKIKINNITLGIGYNKGTQLEELLDNVNSFIKDNKIDTNKISAISSYEIKKEDALLDKLAEKLNTKMFYFSKEEINSLHGEFTKSKALKHLDVKGVAEPAAVLASQFKTLCVKKQIYKNVTIAAAF